MQRRYDSAGAIKKLLSGARMNSQSTNQFSYRHTAAPCLIYQINLAQKFAKKGVCM